jgi:transposase-like protein
VQKDPKNQKESRGGKRSGAGRKPSTIKGVLKHCAKDTSDLILDKIKANQKWIELCNSEDENIRYKALAYLTDRAFGKPKQSMEMSGNLEISSTLQERLARGRERLKNG